MKKSIRRYQERDEPTSLLKTGLGGLAGFAVAAAGSWIVYSSLAIDHDVTLSDALPAERKVFESHTAGRLSYYHHGAEAGRPLVLIHSVNAAASAYEMRPLFLHYMGKRPVYALDLPGFGFSERSKRIYSPGLYQAAVLDFLETQVREPADVVGLSLGCEFIAHAALEKPELFNSIVMLSPTGFNQGKGDRGSQKAGRSGTSNVLHPIFSFPVWARAFFDLIATRSSIQYFLAQSFIGPVPQDLIDYAYASSHQPGAENAPLYFISGKLFSPDIRTTVYSKLQVPTLVLYDRDNFTSFEMLPHLLAENANWQGIRLVPTLGLPQFERTEDTVQVLDRFWKESDR